MKLAIHSNIPVRFSPLFIALALCFPFPGRADTRVVSETTTDALKTAINAASAGDTITISSGTAFGSSDESLTIGKSNLTLQGSTASGFGSGVANLTFKILQQVNAGKDVSAASLSELLNGWTNAYASETENVGLSSISLSGGSTRTTLSGNYFYNTTKLLSVAADNAGGLSLENLRFNGVSVTYSNSRIVNGLIGNINTALADSSLGNLRSNAFTDLSVALNGTVDTQYMAGGAIIGIRSVEGSASIGDISGNVFKGLRVNITNNNGDSIGAYSNAAYLEGGGIIGVDGVSSPAANSGRADINSLSNNLFTDIKVHSGDILLGGGLVGVNNNSQNQDAGTFARLGRVESNVFGSGVSGTTYDIDVDIGYSIRGGGVIGVNGLSNASVSIDGLKGNVFNGISVKTTSYIKGGGVVGLQTQYVEGDLSAKTSSPNDSPGGGDIEEDGGDIEEENDDKFSNLAATAVDQISASAGLVENNLFLNTQVETGSYLSGGGIIGLRANTGFASLSGLANNTFKGLTVEVGDTSNTSNIGLNGGGIVGVSSGRFAAFGVGTDAVSGNYFDELAVTVTGGDLNGGGIIGVQYGDQGAASSQGFALVNNIKDNTFRNLEVTTAVGNSISGNITGGGIVGMSGQSAVGALEGFTGFSGNRFDSLAVSSVGSLSGGGIVGAYSTGGSVSINAFADNVFTNATSVTSTVGLAGGGIVGVHAGGSGTAGITGISNNHFGGFGVSSATLSGGGIVGAYSASGSAGLVNVTSNAFADTTVTAANNGLQGGGVVGAYSGSGSVDIENLDGNTFTNIRITTTAGNFSGGGVVGVSTAGSADKIAGVNGISNNRFSGIEVGLQGTLSGGGIVGASSGGLAAITGFRNNLFENNQVSAAGAIDGGIVGIRGTGGAAIDTIDGSVFQGNTVTSDGGSILGGLFYSNGLAGGLIISDSLFTNNTFNASDTLGRVYGAVTVDTGVKAADDDGDHNALTLRATAGKTTIFSNNVVADDYEYDSSITNITEENSRRNALYFGAISNTDAQSDATLNIDAQAGGAVVLDDPIRVAQSNDMAFTMNVTGEGDFIWGGENIFEVNSSDADNAVNLKSGSKTTIQSGFRLGAVNHAFNVEAGGRLNVMGNDEMWVDQANLNGELYFNLNGTTVNDSNAPLLKVHTDPGNASVAGSTVILSDFGAAAPLLQTGDEFYLIQGDPGELVGDPANDHATARVGATRRYNFVIDKNPTGVTGDDTWLVARLLEMDAAPEAKVLLEGRTASLAFLGQRAGWLADHSYQSADMAFGGHDNGRSWAPFAGADVAWVRVDTGGGSRLNINAGTTVLAGAATRDKTAAGRAVLLGVFVEGGYADYRTRDCFPDQGTIKGSGTLKSLGGGLMGRVEWESGFRLEGSLRAGKQENKFHSREYRDADGVYAKYDFHSPYLAAHVGLANTWKIDERNSFDLLGRYFWVRQQGGHATLPTGERVTFEDDESRRLRMGGRFTHVKDERASWYGGAAIEHEFDGRARGSAHGHEFDSPKLKGTSGVFDLGIIFRPVQDKPYSIETGLQAYVGKIRGISGGVRIGREF